MDIAAFSLNPPRVFRTLALWLGLAAVMVQAIAPLCAAGLMGSADRTAGVASIILCTAHGFEKIEIGADGKFLPSTPVHDHQSTCPLCAAMHAGNAFAPSAPVLATALPSATVARIDFLSAPLPSRKFAFAYLTRGPPASA